ncbi:trypsin-like peptidase domain-containing protein [Patescibacteria group bacterium]|nr:trypsin-like peptidase domain-containing protein [Patescibacteria group bacterium]
MEELTKFQLVLLVLLVSFFTSLVTGIVSVTLVNQAPAQITQTISRVIERVIPNDFVANTRSAPILTSEELVINIVAETLPAVVSVIATKDIPVIEQFFINPFEDDDVFGGLIPPELIQEFRVPQFRQKGTEKRQISSGTGFFISEDGFLVTNRHVVGDKKAEYAILMNDGRRLAAEVLARDPIQDIAILKVKGEGFSYIRLGDSNRIRVGQSVVAIGNVLGEFQNTVSIGVVSGLRRTVIASGAFSGPEILQEVIQTDAAINPGNSGGPLLDLMGRAIGINTAVARGAENVGFALPINIIKKAIKDVREFGEIRYAFLGIRYLMITPEIKEQKDLSVDYGALLIKGKNGEAAVVNGSPAMEVGLREGDIILEFAGSRITKESTLAKLITRRRVGDNIELKVLRGSEELVVEVTLSELPNNF